MARDAWACCTCSYRQGRMQLVCMHVRCVAWWGRNPSIASPGGHKDYESMLPLVCNDAAAILLMFDLTRNETLDSIRDWHRKARERNKCAMPMIVGVKYDQLCEMPAEEQRCVGAISAQQDAARVCHRWKSRGVVVRVCMMEQDGLAEGLGGAAENGKFARRCGTSQARGVQSAAVCGGDTCAAHLLLARGAHPCHRCFQGVHARLSDAITGDACPV